MKAVACSRSLPVSDAQALFDCELPRPEPGPHDLLVEVRAIAVNPVDCKVRKMLAPDPGEPKVLGWDASGVVCEVGAAVQGFHVGDEVFYAGDLNRPGCNAQYQTVDARIVGHKPRSVGFAESAALPLTSLTAWELLFDRLQLEADAAASGLLIVGAAGGVGSIMVQLAACLTRARVFATCGRPASRDWLHSLAPVIVLDHGQDLVAQLRALNAGPITHVASLTHTDQHYPVLVEAMAPQGRFGLIDDPMALDIKAFKRKSISVHWEFMYTRSLYRTVDMARQAEILERVAQLVDAGRIRSTMAQHFGRIDAQNLRRAHALLESRQARGKIVLEGF
jgi:zinc-binding alcohol dehydrogenase family protein